MMLSDSVGIFGDAPRVVANFGESRIPSPNSLQTTALLRPSVCRDMWEKEALFPDGETVEWKSPEKIECQLRAKYSSDGTM